MGIESGKRPLNVDGVVKNIQTRQGLWDEFERAVRFDPRELFSNRSEAIRHFMVKYIEEVEKIRSKG